MGRQANILVLGNSGAGKSTLINAVMGKDLAETGKGEHVTERIKVYDEGLPFRLVDSRGFEYSGINSQKTIWQINKYMKANFADEDQRIHMIWFCVDATSGRITDRTIHYLKYAKKQWKDIPLIAVLTKSYFETEDEENILLVKTLLANKKEYIDEANIIPVLAFSPKGMESIPPRGIIELIERTNSLVDDAIKESGNEFLAYERKQKEILAHGYTVTCATGAAVIGAVPIPFPDASLLVPLETALVTGITKIYKLNQDDSAVKKFIETIIATGTVGILAKQVINAIKAIPGLANIAADILNAIIAATIVAGIGEAMIVVMKKIEMGEIKIEEVEKAEKIVADHLNASTIKFVNSILEALNTKELKNVNLSDILQAIKNSLGKTSNTSSKK